MSALYGWMKGDRPTTSTRASHNEITTTVATWQGSVRVELDRHGDYRVTVGPHPSGGAGVRIVVAQGNVDAEVRAEVTSDLA